MLRPRIKVLCILTVLVDKIYNFKENYRSDQKSGTENEKVTEQFSSKGTIIPPDEGHLRAMNLVPIGIYI